ncbi:DUF371 domain-containing protein [Actinokineospora globicatena]|uniref:DUF371 domain-containing protein n=1 Tax=Actinokineospora globicatena TaxID=103729 RepID=UPI0020A2A29C|nr:DUF371 domain-containing protein [Actinokineospora globicatena]MCP2305187.1 hypothetical protein [Actinokineospora globicatena]GLW80660.1 hypothetical protein Aglo01_51410 [Actinokineospora globicatena]GLW87487.1 hypothetical protein Aglo02_51260 [Actinokineospora globicatena]
MATELLRLRCRGHQDIRATHGKTLEFTADAAITGRATCVVGVAGEVVGLAPPAVAGPVFITISSGGVSATVRAQANSRWRPGGNAVVRRSGQRMSNTLATDADLSSADLPRELAVALSDPDVVVDVVVTRAETSGTHLVRYRGALSPDDRLSAECAAADVIVAEDAGARALVTALGFTPSRDINGPGRTLAVSTVDGTSASVSKLLAEGASVEVLGLPPELAVAGAAPQVAPLLVATGLSRRDVVKLAATTRTARVVFTCPASDLPRWLADAQRVAGTEHVSVMTVDERPTWGPVSEFANLSGSASVWCALDPTAGPVAVDLDVAGLLTALLGQEVAASTLARALAAQPGWSRKQAYDFVLGLAKPG